MWKLIVFTLFLSACGPVPHGAVQPAKSQIQADQSGVYLSSAAIDAVVNQVRQEIPSYIARKSQDLLSLELAQKIAIDLHQGKPEGSDATRKSFFLMGHLDTAASTGGSDNAKILVAFRFALASPIALQHFTIRLDVHPYGDGQNTYSSVKMRYFPGESPASDQTFQLALEKIRSQLMDRDVSQQIWNSEPALVENPAINNPAAELKLPDVSNLMNDFSQQFSTVQGTIAANNAWGQGKSAPATQCTFAYSAIKGELSFEFLTATDGYYESYEAEFPLLPKDLNPGFRTKGLDPTVSCDEKHSPVTLQVQNGAVILSSQREVCTYNMLLGIKTGSYVEDHQITILSDPTLTDVQKITYLVKHTKKRLWRSDSTEIASNVTCEK